MKKSFVCLNTMFYPLHSSTTSVKSAPLAINNADVTVPTNLVPHFIISSILKTTRTGKQAHIPGYHVAFIT